MVSTIATVRVMLVERRERNLVHSERMTRDWVTRIPGSPASTGVGAVVVIVALLS